MTNNGWTGMAGGAVLALLLGLPIGANAQAPSSGNGANGQGSMGTTTGGGAAANQQLPKDVQQNLQKLHAGNQAEIRTGRMAEQRAASPEVKQLASTLVRDHTQLDQQLTQFAQQQGISDLEGQAYQNELAKLENKSEKQLGNKSGEAFDVAYTKLMVNEHKQDVDKNIPQWTREAERANATQVTTMLQNTDQTLKKHLDLAEQARSAERQEAKGQHGQQGQQQ